jgi:hypothetical protein
MAKAKRFDFEDPVRVTDEADEQTLAAIDEVPHARACCTEAGAGRVAL